MKKLIIYTKAKISDGEVCHDLRLFNESIMWHFHTGPGFKFVNRKFYFFKWGKKYDVAQSRPS